MTHAPAAVAWKDLFRGGGMRLVRADYPPALRQHRHWHAYDGVTLVLSGGVEEQVGSRTEVGGALSVVTKRAGVEHACRWGDRGACTLSLELEPAVAASLAEPQGDGAPWAWMERERAARALLRLYQAWRDGRLAAEADDLLLALRADVTPARDDERTVPPPWLARARAALRDASPGRLSTRALAHDAGVHPVHFARVFLRHVGCSPTEYARWLRLRATVAAMASVPARDIGPTAHHCGYHDHAHLCREFRRSLDVTPTLLRSLSRPVAQWDDQLAPAGA